MQDLTSDQLLVRRVQISNERKPLEEECHDKKSKAKQVEPFKPHGSAGDPPETSQHGPW